MKNLPPVTLALDFGTKRVGIAISRGSLAEPLQIIANDEHTLAEIARIATTEQVEQIVVGVSENVMAELSTAFAAQVGQVTALPIKLWDETLSSYAVGEKLKNPGVSAHRRQRAIDHLAAAEFLQDYLDSI